MRIALWVALVLDQFILLILAAIHLDAYELTDFQLKERVKQESPQRGGLLKKLHKSLPLIRRQQQIKIILLFAVGTALFTHLFNPPVLGFIWMLAVTLAILVARRIAWLQTQAHRLFENRLDILITTAGVLKPLDWLIGKTPQLQPVSPHSREELIDVITRMDALAAEERRQIQLMLEIEQKTAHDIMTPAKKVTHVSPGATLGPILLSELEKSTHGYFPVLDKKEGVIGILDLKQVGDVASVKHHKKVADIMNEEVVWVPADLTVREIAQMFLHAKQYILLVQDESREFAGVVTIADLFKHTIAIET